MQAQQALELSPNAAVQAPPPLNDVRRQLAKRLSDVICIPASHLTPQERHMAGDILVELLRDADVKLTHIEAINHYLSRSCITKMKNEVRKH